MNIDISKMENLLAEKRFKEAKALLHGYFKQPLSRKEEGELYTLYLSVYLQVMAEVNRRYTESLKEVTSTLKNIDYAEERARKEFSLAEARKGLYGEE